MIYLGFPYGSNFGWGVLGKEVAFALAEQTEIRVLAPQGLDQRLDDELENFRLKKLLVSSARCGRRVNNAWRLDGQVIHAVVGHNLEPFVAEIAEPADLGYAVFEETVFSSSTIERARRQYRRIVAASNFCADVLRQHGLSDISVLPHGVDTTWFTPRNEPRAFLKDRFIVFSGGKFEFRKGQDIVIRAYKVLQDRHKDVMLVTSWYNNWPKTRDTMKDSRWIRYFPPQDSDYHHWIGSLLTANGIDVERVVSVGPRNHRLLPETYHATDLGVFPNRAEGGNNMVMMEYLACGKPALASYNAGHIDILRRQNAILIEGHQPVECRQCGELTGVWNEPSLEETITKLEWCYQNRNLLAAFGRQAAADMQGFTWTKLAEGLVRAILG